MSICKSPNKQMRKNQTQNKDLFVTLLLGKLCSYLLRIEYKISLLCFNFFSGSSPQYLASCLSVYSPNRCLRSASDTRILNTPFIRTKLGSRAFASSAPCIWNALPFDIRHCSSQASFKRSLKTFLFRKYLE